MKASDIVLGGVLVVVGLLASTLARGAGLFPAVISWALVAAGVLLVARTRFLKDRPPARWSLASLLIIAAAITAWDLVKALLATRVVLTFGPAEFATIIVLQLAVAIALARLSYLRAAGIVLLGLLLSVVGSDLSSGEPRFTMGLDALNDGLALAIVALGLFVIADAAVCFGSPALFVQLYARQVGGAFGPTVPTIAGIGMRGVAVLAVAGACYYAYGLNNSIADLGTLAVFGVFGIACRIYGWNRLLLVFALSLGQALEENIRRALLISRGDPLIFMQRPYSASFLLLACAILAVVAVLSLRTAFRAPPDPGRV